MSRADDFMKQLNPDNFDKMGVLYTPMMQLWLENGCLMVTVPYGKFSLNADDTKQLTRFLSEHVKVDPLPPAGDFEDYQPKRIYP